MTKTVFRPGEIEINETKIFLDPPRTLTEMIVPEIEDIVEEEYEGPTIEELRQEAELFKSQWESERETMMRSAKLEVERIIKEAEDEAFQEVSRKTGEAEALKEDARAEAERIIEEANQKAREIIAASQVDIETRKKKAEEQGEIQGREAGFQQGKIEVDRLIERTQLVLERAQDKRGEILVETEQRIIDLVILIARKVIKTISENQRDVVAANVQEALRKVKGRGDVIIRVHTADLQLTTDHIKDFIQTLEGPRNIQVQEDSSVDKGGCVIETDFGEIDARISSQLTELETKIMETVPIKTKSKPVRTSASDEEKG
ncbi:MAG: flagellar assembly protein FliH [Spirochaetaceae bacterium]|jgi:flagellar assembly protein FliH|nr:flagellar assembly protein FliH [Spirochaetaceae bacterium]